MATFAFGHTLLISNPAAHSDTSERGAAFVDRFFGSFQKLTKSYTSLRTEHSGHATTLAARYCAEHLVDTILVLGGDGVINEVVNGIMTLPPKKRPTIAVIPFGSGNDFARTLGVTANKAERAIEELCQGHVAEFDLGLVRYQAKDHQTDNYQAGAYQAKDYQAGACQAKDCQAGDYQAGDCQAGVEPSSNSLAKSATSSEGSSRHTTKPSGSLLNAKRYFVQTMSMGLDAQIADYSSMNRQANSLNRGRTVFVSAGIQTLKQAHTPWSYTATIDEVLTDGSAITRSFSGENLMFAVQVGPTYGGGFIVCPSASPVDGKLSVCYNHKVPHPLQHLMIFALIRAGKHTHHPQLTLTDCTRICLDYEKLSPAQTDGEIIHSKHFEITSVSKALRVLVPHGSNWD